MWGIYYNELFDSLIGIKQDLDDSIIEVQDGLTLIKDKQSNDIIGFNLFNVDQDLILHQGFNSFNPETLTFLKTKLAPNFNFEQTKQFVVGKVEVCEPIVDTHLHLTKVNVGDQSLQIVCGAKNIATNQLVVVALVGAWMPNGSQIQPGKLRGNESFGMICSAKELSLVNHPFNNEGIIELDSTYEDKIGQDFFSLIR